MKKIILLLTILFLGSTTNFAQDNFGRPYLHYSKHQKKVLRKIGRGKKHKRFIPFNHRSQVNNPVVKKKTRKELRRRYLENIRTRN